MSFDTVDRSRMAAAATGETRVPSPAAERGRQQSVESPTPSFGLSRHDSDVPRPTVVAAIRDNEWRAHVRARLGARSTLAFVEDVDQLPLIAATCPPDIVLWHLDSALDSTANAYGAAFERLRRVAPGTVVIAYGQVDRAIAPLLLAAGRAGVDRLLLRGLDDLELRLRESLRSSEIDSTIRTALAQLNLPRNSAALAFAHCLRRANAGSITVHQLANELHINRKTLSVWLRSVGLPAPQLLIGWCRVCNVAVALAHPRRSVAQAARLLGFSSATDLRRMVSRYIGCTPTEMRLAGGITMVLGALRSRMATQRSSGGSS
jgi:AraC-like DNA-binding protein